MGITSSRPGSELLLEKEESEKLAVGDWRIANHPGDLTDVLSMRIVLIPATFP
jgi:hypothetical protein